MYSHGPLNASNLIRTSFKKVSSIKWSPNNCIDDSQDFKKVFPPSGVLLDFMRAFLFRNSISLVSSLVFGTSEPEIFVLFRFKYEILTASAIKVRN